MAAVARIGNTDFHTQIRPGNPDRVIGPVIVAHIDPAGHVALDTLGTGAHRKQDLALRRANGLSNLALLFMKMMPFCVIAGRLVALQAEGIALFVQGDGMGIVAVGAAHPVGIHFGLDKGSVHIDLVQDLAVRIIQPLFQQPRHLDIEQVLALRDIIA